MADFLQVLIGCCAFFVGANRNHFIIQMSENKSMFPQFVSDVDSRVDISKAIERLSNDFCLIGYKVNEITPDGALELYRLIQDKFYKKQHQNLSNNWYENELRIFVWSLVCYTEMKICKIEDLTYQDWNFFSKLFIYKDPKLFEYQARALAKEPTKGKHWEKYEEDLLKGIMVMNSDKIKWNEISKELYHNSNKKYFRTAKQCRQHWNNHLDPKKIKGNWKMHECLTMFQFVRLEGKKWANLVKKLGNNRNQHSIKNKFNSLVKKQKKLNKGLEEDEIYDVIISRIQKAMSRQSVRSSEMSFDQEFNSSNQGLYKDEAISKKIKEETPKASTYTQKFRLKLQHFKIGQEKQITTAPIITDSSIKDRKKGNQQKPEIKESYQNQSCSISEVHDFDEPKLDLDEYGKIPLLINDQFSSEQREEQMEQEEEQEENQFQEEEIEQQEIEEEEEK